MNTEPGTRNPEQPAALPRIYLTGYMGSGKTTLGRPLAEALGYAFVDLDALIEERAGRSIPAIFAEEGEAVFRQREAELLREVAGRKRVVAALGGGALTFPENLSLALQTGLVVYLRVPPEQLVRRLAARIGRPLLMGSTGAPLSEQDLRRKVDLMIGLREVYYGQAHVTVDVGEADEAESLAALLDAVKKAGAKGPQPQEP